MARSMRTTTSRPWTSILAANGETVRTLEVPATAGTHRVAWDLRYGPFDEPEEETDAEEGVRFRATAPRVNPGTYTARLTVTVGEPDSTIAVALDPRLRTSRDDLDAQLEAIQRAGRIGAAAASLVRELDSAREQLVAWRDRLAALESPPAGLSDSAGVLIDAADSIRVRIERPEDEDDARRLAYVPLVPRLSGLIRQVGRATARPTDARAASLDRYSAEWGEVRGLGSRFFGVSMCSIGRWRRLGSRRSRPRTWTNEGEEPLTLGGSMRRG